jgi:hypothetical protein
MIDPSEDIASGFRLEQFGRTEIANGALELVDDPRLDPTVRESDSLGTRSFPTCYGVVTLDQSY